jgi:D-beta-D-heptose 7-phosphate kinase/D-beta-D-heptose 1-phosphate adenosyltransferase
LATTDVVLVSDYLKGVVTRPIMRALVAAAAERGIPLLVDPKIPHIDLYRGATLITPNHHEAETATAMRIRTDADAAAAARAFQARAGCESVLVTRGEHGMWLLEGRWPKRPPGDGPADTPAIATEIALPAAAREVSDVTGAGDTVIATVALGLAAGGTLVESAALANFAAGVAVAKFGPATVSPAELLEQLDTHAAATG